MRTGETFETNAAKDLIVTRDLIQGMAGTFLGEGGNRRDPLANPLHADLKGFPPICDRARPAAAVNQAHSCLQIR
jgi:hypothetical protein